LLTPLGQCLFVDPTGAMFVLCLLQFVHLDSLFCVSSPVL
jgi:hypothetical protein